MHAGTTAATTHRRRGGRVAGAFIATAIVFALVALPAGTLAKGGGSTPTGSFIALTTVGGTAATTKPMLGNWVGFATGYPGATKNPWISLTCTENGATVYGEGGGPTHQFQLGGASSDWWAVGGTANCTAELGDLYWKGGHEYYTYLATTSFSAN